MSRASADAAHLEMGVRASGRAASHDERTVCRCARLRCRKRLEMTAVSPDGSGVLRRALLEMGECDLETRAAISERHAILRQAGRNLNNAVDV